MPLTTRSEREAHCRAVAETFGLNPDELIVAADAAWSALNPQSTPYHRAFDAALAVLRAVAQREWPYCSVCATRVHPVAEEHWTGWVDETGDQLSYAPYLHDHIVPEVIV